MIEDDQRGIEKKRGLQFHMSREKTEDKYDGAGVRDWNEVRGETERR